MSSQWHQKTIEATNKLLYELETSSIAQIKEYLDRANLTARDDKGNTALHVALNAKNKNEDRIVEIVKLMIQAGADVDGMNESNETPLVWSIWLGLLSVARLLLGHGANKAITVEGATLQHFAAASAYPRSLEFLSLTLQVDFEVVDNEGKTPLMIAAERNLSLHLKWLMAHGVDPRTTDDSGETALFKAVRTDSKRAVWVLLEFEPYMQLRIKNKRHVSVIQIAHQQKSPLYRDLKRLAARQNHCCRPWFDKMTNNIYRLQSRRWTAFLWKIVFIILVILVTVQTVLYFRKFNLYWSIALLSLLVTGNILYLRLFLMNPGFIKTTVVKYSKHKRQTIEDALLTPPHIAAYEQAVRLATKDNVCITCKCIVPPRSKHCKELDRCVYRYDHYCPFVGTAVGSRNHGSFIFFLLWYLIVFAFYFYLSYWSWLKLYEEVLEIKRHLPELIISGLAGIGCLLFFIFDVSLLGSHLYLVSKNLTTNEFINYTKYDYLLKDGNFENQFNRGCCRNCYRFWCRRHREEDKDTILNWSHSDGLSIQKD